MVSLKNIFSHTQPSWYVAGGVLVIIDLLSKLATYGVHMGPIQSVVNHAGAWGVGFHHDILIIIACCMIAIIGWMTYKKHISSSISLWLLAGAIGNVYDRFLYDGVRDRISIGPFPVFNIADICITIGVILFLYKEYYLPLRGAKK